MALYQQATQTEKKNVRLPITDTKARELAEPPQGVSRQLWLYELCRLLVEKTNLVIVGLFSSSPPCSATTCPEMRASEWQYLCASHEPPKACSAIDYSCHTLDWAANVLTSPKYFPSRLTLGDDQNTGREGYRHLVNIFRRVYRVYAHTWHSHRDVFWQIENQYGLYVLYKTVCDVYQLIPEESYTIPPEAEGAETADPNPFDAPPIDSYSRGPNARESPITPQAAEPLTGTTLSTGAVTRKHRHTPSTGSIVPTISEGDEEGETGAPTDRHAPLDTNAMPNTVRHDPAGSPQRQNRSPKKLSISSPTKLRFLPVEPPIEEMGGAGLGASGSGSGSGSSGTNVTERDEGDGIVLLPPVFSSSFTSAAGPSKISDPYRAAVASAVPIEHEAAGQHGIIDRNAGGSESESDSDDAASEADTIVLLPTDDFGRTIVSAGHTAVGDGDEEDSIGEPGSEGLVGEREVVVGKQGEVEEEEEEGETASEEQAAA